MEIGVRQAKIDLSKLIQRARNGEQVLITNNGKPVAELKPVRRPRDPQKGYGRLKEKLKGLPEDWDSPANDTSVLSLFESRDFSSIAK